MTPPEAQPPEGAPPGGTHQGPEATEAGLPDAAAATTGASVFRGGLWYALTLLLPQTYTLAISVAAARALGPADMGRQSFISFVELSLVVLAGDALSQSLMRYAGELAGSGRMGDLRRLIRWSWGVMGVGAVVITAVVVSLGPLRGELQSSWALAGLAGGVAVLSMVPSSVLIGLQRWRASSIVSLATSTVATVATVVALGVGGGIPAMFAIELVAAVALLAWTTRLVRREVAGDHPESSPEEQRVLRRRVVRFTGLGMIDVVLSLIIWRRSEFLFLERYADPTEIAFYSVAFAAVTAVTRLPQSFGIVTASAFATLHGAGIDERIRSGFSRAMRMMTLLSLPVTAGALAVGPATVHLVYGNEYRETGTVMVVLLLALPTVALLTVADSLLIGVESIRIPILIRAVAAAVNIALDVALIPDHGAVGAAIANSVAQVVAAVPVIVFAGMVVGAIGLTIAGVARAGVIAAAGGLVAWAIVEALPDIAGVPAAVVAGSLTMLVVAAAVRPLSEEDAAWVQDVVGERFSGPVGRVARLIS